MCLTLLASSCKSVESTSSSNRSGAITIEEISASGFVFTNAYEIVRQLRPQWLIERGVSTFIPSTNSNTLLDFIAVYVDRNFMGDPETLRGVPALQVEQIHFLDAGRAQRLGSRSHIHGAIVLTTRTQ